MSSGGRQCEVCRGAAAKYKCPTCRLKYCSVRCYKSHQSQPCQAAEVPCRPAVEDAESCVSQQQILFPTDDTVAPHTLEKLKDCDKLKDLLGNPHLRQLLREVDGAANAQAAMRRAMLEPIFTEFADAALGVVEPDLEAANAPAPRPSKKQHSS
ncbi:Zinc finger HIT domain-containing protein 3 [Chionoecetes opilio]|uniref:Zinc finger HIT domain-containing protein 3 n=1 Tax=Chionoecetes opilio TaxID=41210 RepID=A0A8J4XN51_CHIOP|nr:Zinc finger HIT domain-containing protein 3 [Chionoecetes opilio]